MKNWNDLSIKDRTKYIKLGIDNGITDLQTIRNAYNSFAEGGDITEDNNDNANNTVTHNFSYENPVEYNGNVYPTASYTLNGVPNQQVFADASGRTFTLRDNVPYEVAPEYNLPNVDITYSPTLGKNVPTLPNGNIDTNQLSFRDNQLLGYQQMADNGVTSAFHPEDTMDFINVATLGLMNRGSLTQDARLLYDIHQALGGDKSWMDVWNSALGNDGVFNNDAYDLIADIALGGGVYGAVSHTPRFLSRALTRGKKWWNLAERVEDFYKQRKNYIADMESKLHNMGEEYNRIMDPSYKVYPALDNVITEYPSVRKPIKYQKMSPQNVVETANKLYGRNSNVIIKDINGKPTAVSPILGVYPENIVTTGPYHIPRFSTGEMVEGNLDIQRHIPLEYHTQYDEVLKDTASPRTVSGAEPLREVLTDNYNQVTKELPGFKGFGSSIGVKEGALDHITHDIDGAMSSEDFAKLQGQSNMREVVPGETYTYYIQPEKYGMSPDGANAIDVNIIHVDPKTSLGNSRATELYRQFFPKEYRESVIKMKTEHPNETEVPIVHLDGTPITSKELIDKMNPLRKTIMDSMESGKDKHLKRMAEYLAGDNPDAVADALQSTYKEMIQNGAAPSLPKFKFGTPEENAAILQKIGFKGDIGTIAADPKKMQNTMDLWYLTEGGVFSRATNVGDLGQVGGTRKSLFRNLTDWNETDINSGGHNAGAFLNTLNAPGNGGVGGTVFGLYLPKIRELKNGMNADEAIDLINQARGYYASPISIENADKIIPLLRKRGFNGIADDLEKNKGNYTFTDLMDALPSSGTEVKELGKEINKVAGINAMGNPAYNNTYAGFIGDINPEEELGIFNNQSTDRYSFRGFPSWNARIESLNNNNNMAPPFKLMERHFTTDKSYHSNRIPVDRLERKAIESHPNIYKKYLMNYLDLHTSLPDEQLETLSNQNPEEIEKEIHRVFPNMIASKIINTSKSFALEDIGPVYYSELKKSINDRLKDSLLDKLNTKGERINDILNYRTRSLDEKNIEAPMFLKILKEKNKYLKKAAIATGIGGATVYGTERAINNFKSKNNKYAHGGFLPMNYSQYEEALSQYWGGEDLDTHDYDYRQYYNDNPIEALAQLEMLRSGGYGHFPDGRNGRIYKTLNHPTHPDLAEDSWSNNDTTFNISSRQLNSDDPYYNTDRTLDYLGSDLNYNNGGINVMYDDGYVLPTLYVTPNKNYTELVPNKLHTGWVYEDSPYRAYALGGGLEEDFQDSENKFLTTGNIYADTALSFVPGIGAAMDIEDAIRNPSFGTIGTAALSTAGDILGFSAVKGAVKAAKLAKNIRKASKAVEKTGALPEVKKAFRILDTPNLSPRKYARANATLKRSGHTQNLINWDNAVRAQSANEKVKSNEEVASLLAKKMIVPFFSNMQNTGQQYQNIMLHQYGKRK